MNRRTRSLLSAGALAYAVISAVGCGSGPKQDQKFFTSGNREADQRADQRMAKSEQLKGEGSGSGDDSGKAGAKVAEANAHRTLYDRLGGEAGMQKIVGDFVDRAIADPRVNWQRTGVTKGGFMHRSRSVAWNATPATVEQLKKHIVQFLSIATGGPSFYDGREMKSAHAGLHISNAEFDASVGDVKATLDKLQIPNKEQKELLSIIESTRPQVAEER